MKILIINPPRVKGCPVVREDRFEHRDFDAVYPPLSLLYTSSVLLNNGFDVRFIDANGLNVSIGKVTTLIKKYSPDILITRFALDSIKEDLEILRIAKEETNCTTISRCEVISDTPWLKEKILHSYPFIDVLVDDELEFTILEIIKSITQNKSFSQVKGITYRINGKLITTTKKLNETDLPNPSYDLLPSFKPYGTPSMKGDFGIFLSSRGCPYSCSFCVHRNKKYRARLPTKVADEIEWAHGIGIKKVCFFDDTFTFDLNKAKSICKELVKRRIDLEWTCSTRVDRVNLDLLKMMQRAGCKTISYGIESASDIILKKSNKQITIGQMKKAIKLTKQAGIRVYLNVILGLPGENKKTIRKTELLIKELDPEYCQFCFAVPYPNTPIFDYFSKRGEIISYDWSKYNPLEDPVISTSSLSASDLKTERKILYRTMILNPNFLVKNMNRMKVNNFFTQTENYFKRLINTVTESRIR